MNTCTESHDGQHCTHHVSSAERYCCRCGQIVHYRAAADQPSGCHPGTGCDKETLRPAITVKLRLLDGSLTKNDPKNFNPN